MITGPLHTSVLCCCTCQELAAQHLASVLQKPVVALLRSQVPLLSLSPIVNSDAVAISMCSFLYAVCVRVEVDVRANFSKYKGVCWHKNMRKWIGQAQGSKVPRLSYG